MSQKVIILVGFLFGCIVLGMFIFAYVFSTETEQDTTSTQNDQAQKTPLSEEFPIDELVLTQEFLLGTHMLKGFAPVPADCYVFEQSYQIAESYPEQVSLDILISTDEEDCSNPVVALPVLFELKASEQAIFTLKINHQLKPLTLIYE